MLLQCRMPYCGFKEKTQFPLLANLTSEQRSRQELCLASGVPAKTRYICSNHFVENSTNTVKIETNDLINTDLHLSNINLRCQFCLKELDDQSVVVSEEQKQCFFELTQQTYLDGMAFSEFACAFCLQKFEEIIEYRNVLVKNQRILKFHQAMKESDIKLERSDERTNELVTPHCFNCNEYLSSQHVCSQKYEDFTANVTEKKPAIQKTETTRKIQTSPVSSESCQFICQHCGKVCKNLKRLNAHLLYHLERKYKCDRCTKQFVTPGDLRRHIRVHTKEKPFMCHICSKSYTQSTNLKFHMDTHSDSGFVCDMCGSCYKNRNCLRTHILKCLNRNDRDRSQTKRGRNKIGVKKDTPVYKCFVNDCDRHFCVRSHLGRHIKRDHDMEIDRFETTCLECQLVFNTVGEHASHVKTHSCKFICDLCKVRFKTEEKLQIHVAKFHHDGEDRPFICSVQDCGARFKRAAHLESHRVNMHSDERKFECNVCGLKFRDRGGFNVHRKIHTNEKPFSCWACSVCCRTSTLLRQHMIGVHNEARIYCCKACPQKFDQRTELAQHEKCH